MPRTITVGASLACAGAMAALALGATSSLCAADAPDASAGPVSIIDTHAHLVSGTGAKTMGSHRLQHEAEGRGDAGSATRDALRAMSQYGVETTIFLPPPFPPGHPGIYGRSTLEPIARQYPGRIAFVAGGETLNSMIQEVAADKVTTETLAEFKREAEAIVNSGAAGFGELAAEHLSSGRGRHPYESAPPDHPLLLALADLAAQYGMPIDLHMEAVPQDMPTPERMLKGPNPVSLRANIAAFERLLAHNRHARIIWAHAGWDLTGERTVPLMRSLLERNPNLYMSLKLHWSGSPVTKPLDRDGKLRPGWLALLRDFPDRFLIGSDQFYDEGTDHIEAARAFVDLLPPDLARRVAHDNARQVYRLGAAMK